MNANMNKFNYFWQGKKVLLRPIRSEDWKAIYGEEFDSESIRVFEPGIPLPRSEEMVQKWTEKAMNDSSGTLRFSIQNMNEEFVGMANIHSQDHRNGTFSYTIHIFKAFRRKGYALDALRILLKYGFHELRFQKANSETLASNEGSISLHERMGFIIEGTRRSNVFTNGRYYDEVLFGMTREEFDLFEKKYASRHL